MDAKEYKRQYDICNNHEPWIQTEFLFDDVVGCGQNDDKDQDAPFGTGGCLVKCDACVDQREHDFDQKPADDRADPSADKCDGIHL